MWSYVFLSFVLSYAEPDSRPARNPGFIQGEIDLADFADAAAQAAKGDRRAERLVKLFRKRARTAFRTAPERFVTEKDEPGTVPFIFTLRKSLALLPPVAQCEVCYVVGERGFGVFQLVGDDTWHLWFLGVVLLHEIVHWDDFSVTRRFKADIGPAGTRQAEVRAHTVSDAALHRLLGPAYGKAIDRVLSDPRLSAAIPGTTLRVPKRAGFEALMTPWPDAAASPFERDSRMDGMTISVIFRQAATERGRVKAYHTLMQRQRDVSDIYEDRP